MELNGSRVLIVDNWKNDPSKKGNVLIKFAMRVTHPITKKSYKKRLSSGENKGWFTTKAKPSAKDKKGNPKLLLSDIKNQQLITKVTRELNKEIDDYFNELLGYSPKKVKKLLTLDEIAKPYDDSGQLYGKAFKAWYERQRPATNTVKTRVTIYNKYIKPNFDVGMTIVQFSGQVKKIQKIIDSSSLSMGRIFYFYIKMIFDWSVENGYLEANQHPILNKRIIKRELSRAEEQEIRRGDIAEKYLEADEARYVFTLIESWTNRYDNQLVADVLKVIFLTGMRPSEVLGLNEDVLDFDSKLIKVHWQRATKNKSDAEMVKFNLEEKERYREDLKTVESIRVIPMTPEVEKILRKYIDRNHFQAKFNETYIDLGYIFTRTYVRKGNKQGSPLYHNEISAFLRGGKSQSAKYNKKSGKPYKDIDEYLDFGRPIHVVPHMFRHSFVSILASEKVPLETIRSLVGHAEDSKEIERVYLHVLKKEKRYMKDVMMNLDEKLSD